jgi:hypothetical protein
MIIQSSFPKIYFEGGMMQMQSIRKRRVGYALLLAASICLAVWLGTTFILEAVSSLEPSAPSLSCYCDW